jgi:hypothetical protein
MVNERRKQTGQQLLLRFPEGSDLRDRLDEIARLNNRSLTAEIIHRLDASLSSKKNNGLPPPDAGRRLPDGDHERRIAALEHQMETALVPDFVMGDRLEKLAKDIAELKKKMGG